MFFYKTPLLNTNSSLLANGVNMQNNAINNIFGSVVKGLQNWQQRKTTEENNAYQNMLMQHLTDFQHQNQGTENERINPYATSNGTNISSYLQNPSQYVSGMTANRAGSIWQKFMQERTNMANNQQNMLNSSIKNTAQQQQNIMQNYINQVGDTNKDGLVDIKDLNPTEQTALQGLYGSVANKLLGTAQQHNYLLSKLNIQHNNRLDEIKTQDDYALARQEKAFKHQDKITALANARTMLGSYQTLYNKAYNDYTKLSQYNPATMTPDQKLQLQNTINNMKNYASQIQHFKALLSGNPNAQQTNNVVALHGSQNNNIINKITNAQSKNNPIIDKIIEKNPVAEYPSNFIVNHEIPEPTHEQMMSVSKPDANWLVHAGQTNSDVAKQVNIVNDLYKNYNKYDKLETTNPFYSIVKNEIANKMNSKVNDNHKANYDNTAMNKILTIYDKSLSKAVQDGYVNKDIAKTLGVPELSGATAGLLHAKISSQIDEAIANTTDKDAVKQLQAIKNSINGYGKQINLNDDIYNPSIFTKLKNDVKFATNTITAPLGLDIYEGNSPANINSAMITFGKMLIDEKPDLINKQFGFHVGSTVLDGTAKDIATHFIPKIKLALAKYYNINPKYIKDDYVKDFIYKGILSGTSGQTHLLDGVKEATGFGSIYHAKPNPMLLNIINSIK